MYTEGLVIQWAHAQSGCEDMSVSHNQQAVLSNISDTMTQHNIVYVRVAGPSIVYFFSISSSGFGIWLSSKQLVEPQCCRRLLHGNDCPSPLYPPPLCPPPLPLCFVWITLWCSRSITAELLTAAMPLSADTVARAATHYLLLHACWKQS